MTCLPRRNKTCRSVENQDVSGRRLALADVRLPGGRRGLNLDARTIAALSRDKPIVR
jgi:hypothetical protein